MAELVFFTGTMDCGKSTLALQMDHNHTARGRTGLIFSPHDRAGTNMLSSRLGLAPGRAFGPEGEGFVRWCFASDQARLADGVARLARFLG